MISNIILWIILLSVLSELRHHRHWQKALENITGCHFTMLPTMLPKEGMILGGNLTLQGKNLSLACFHGINFRSKAWAIFTMNDVYISFATEAQKTQDQGGFYWKFRNFHKGSFPKIKLIKWQNQSVVY